MERVQSSVGQVQIDQSPSRSGGRFFRVLIIMFCAATCFLWMVLPGNSSAAPQGPYSFANERLASVGLKYLGQSRRAGCDGCPGECVMWVQSWVREAGGQMGGGGAISVYQAAGAVPVSLADARRGDVIQRSLGNSWGGSPHTAVLLGGHLGGTTFDVVDGNRVGVGKVGQGRVTFARAGHDVRIWRFGKVGSTTNPTVNDGEFVKVAGQHPVYRVAGGAPIYVNSWNAVGGAKPVKTLSQTQFNGLRPYPADGTFIAGGGHVYRIAGGAPIYVSSWNEFGGSKPFVHVDGVAIDNAGSGGRWRFLRSYPVDGTFIAGGGHVYRIAGGAPIYVSNWNNVGGVQPYVHVDGTAIDNAGGNGRWRFLRAHPVDGTFIAGGGHVYRIAGGAPIYVSNWNNVGGSKPFVHIDGHSVANAGGSGRFRFLRAVPTDGTFIAGGGHVYRIAGGAPIYVSSWKVFGGEQRFVHVDGHTIANAGGSGMYRFLRPYPADGTILEAGLGGDLFKTSNGVPDPFSGSADRPPVAIDPSAIVNAGKSGVWKFLRARPAVIPTPEQKPSGSTPTVKVACPEVAGGCAVTLSASAKAFLGKGKTRAFKLPRKSATISSGTTSRVSLKLPKKVRKVRKKARKIVVTIKVKTEGVGAPAVLKVTLKGGLRKRR